MVKYFYQHCTLYTYLGIQYTSSILTLPIFKQFLSQLKGQLEVLERTEVAKRGWDGGQKEEKQQGTEDPSRQEICTWENHYIL